MLVADSGTAGARLARIRTEISLPPRRVQVRDPDKKMSFRVDQASKGLPP